MQQILVKSKIITGNQEGKRRELANKLQALVSKSEADVTKTALQWNTVRKPLEFQCWEIWGNYIEVCIQYVYHEIYFDQYAAEFRHTLVNRID